MKSKAFSLLELLVVMAIIAVLALVSIPAFEQLVKGSRLTIAGRALIDELSLARQTALSRNIPVEVRFYRLPDNSTSVTLTHYRAFQIFLNDDTNTPLGKAVFLPPGVVIFEDSASSATPKTSLFLKPGPLTDPDPKKGDTAPLLPSYDDRYEYVSFRFKGNGETDLSSTTTGVFLTLISLTDKTTGSGLPANFVTIQIDPVNGRVQSFRP